jgi:CRP-like cAMP-binding protein
VSVLTSGMYFGETGLLLNTCRTATVISSEPSEVLWVSDDEFKVG